MLKVVNMSNIIAVVFTIFCLEVIGENILVNLNALPEKLLEGWWTERKKTVMTGVNFFTNWISAKDYTLYILKLLDVPDIRMQNRNASLKEDR